MNTNISILCPINFLLLWLAFRQQINKREKSFFLNIVCYYNCESQIRKLILVWSRSLSYPSRRFIVVVVTSVKRRIFPSFFVWRFCWYVFRLKCSDEKLPILVMTGMRDGVISVFDSQDETNLRDTLLDALNPSASTFPSSHFRKARWISCGQGKQNKA